ncbi:MAG: cyclodeaminase/cyclohydrolase family protein [Erysipelotrichales bacterium]
MKLVDLNLVEFSNMVNSDSPVPGGGSVAAYTSSLGAGLARMLGFLTINKKKFAALETSIQEEYKKSFDTLEDKVARLLELVDEDTASYQLVMDAFKLPKETEEEKEVRKTAIQEGTYKAMLVPFEAAQVSFDALKISEGLVEHGNTNAISDLASGFYMLEAGMNCSILNVRINASSLDDKDKAKEYLDKCITMQEEARSIVDKNIKIISQVL